MSSLCAAPHPPNATADKREGKKGQLLSHSSHVMFLHRQASENAAGTPALPPPPAKSIKMYFTVIVCNFPLFFLLPEEGQFVKDLLGC